MPNGNDRNWVRACGAIDGFFVRHGHWPTRLRLFPMALEDFRQHLFTDEAFRVLESKLQLIPDPEAPMVAEDDSGHSYSYGDEGFPEVRPQPNAEVWLGVAPDTPHAREG